jgi:glycosyltransferase involved in cell wall biosynthesis
VTSAALTVEPAAPGAPRQSDGPLAALSPTPLVSIVVPGLNEAQSLPELSTRVASALAGVDFELIFVDDGSTDNTWDVVRELNEGDPRVRGLRLRANFGKAMALAAGFREANGRILIMMDADLQDDPADIPLFLDKIKNGYDVVVGWKVARKDPLSRRIASRIFNGTVRRFTGVVLHDMNCGFKAYHRDVIETVPIYGDLFRFIPVLATADGFRVTEVAVRHHPRIFGRSRYGLERILRGFFDLLSVLFLTRYMRRPMHLFGLMGLLSGVVGGSMATYLTVIWFMGHGIGARPLLQLSVMLMVMGVQLTSFGFIGEFMTYQNQKRAYKDPLPVRERI